MNHESIPSALTDDFYTPEELAAYLKVNEATVRLWIRTNKLRAIKVGRVWRIPSIEVRRVLEEGTTMQSDIQNK